MADARDPHVDELAAAYALGALDPDERLLVETRVQGCAACAVVVERARRVSALLPYSAEPRELPSGHVARFMARVAAESRAGVRWRIRHLFPLAAAAALVLGLGAWNLRLQQELAAQQQLVRLFTNADARELAPSVAAGGARGRAFLDRSTDQILVAVSQLPEPSADHTYQLWFTRADGLLDSGGTFHVGEGGTGAVLATAPAGLGAYVGVGITAEPGGGSRSPTAPMIMYWGLSGV
jgi:anti-sigma-K factor RskA